MFYSKLRASPVNVSRQPQLYKEPAVTVYAGGLRGVARKQYCVYFYKVAGNTTAS